MAEITSKTPAKKAPAKNAQAAKIAAAAKAPKAAVSGDKPVAMKTAVKSMTGTTKPGATKAAAETPIAIVVVPRSATRIAGKAMIVSDEQRYRMVAEAAYYRAESNQFKSDPVRDWIEAESDIAALLSGSGSGSRN